MLMRTAETEGSCSTGPNRAFRSCAPKAVGVGVLVGFLTGLLGVGGGFLIAPALTLFLGLRMKQAVGTSLAIIVINSAAGFGAHAAAIHPRLAQPSWPSRVPADPRIPPSLPGLRPPPQRQAHPHLVRRAHLCRRSLGHRGHRYRLKTLTRLNQPQRRTPWA